jgi:hypothetical protein
LASRPTLLGLGLALALAACAEPQGGDGTGEDLIRNGNFIEGFEGWSVQSTTALPPSVALLNDDGCRSLGCEGRSPVGTFAAFNGCDDAPNAILSQTVPTRAGATYVLTFSYGAFDATGNGQQAVEVVVSSGLAVQQTVPIGPVAGSRDLSVLFKSHGLGFVAVGQTTTVTFIDRSPDTHGTDGLLTQVSLKRR